MRLCGLWATSRSLTVGGPACRAPWGNGIEHGKSRLERLERVGPYQLRHDRAGRVCTVGPVQIFYGRGDWNPVGAQLQSTDEPLSDELLPVLFLVLFWQKQAWDAYYQAHR
ncbi:hypothetical protein GCM10010234_79140 [Streptomyces hawaiiensis]